jgi:methylmalonyl-CoA mutase N-terminal domain/subunit
MTKAYDHWFQGKYCKSLEKFPERREKFETSSSWPLPPVFEAEGLPFPGDHPYTRGVQASMYRSRLWTMRQYAGFSSAKESNRRYRYLLEQGAAGLSVAFDLPTQIGYDSDDVLSHGEVGRVGVPVSSLKDMEILFEGIPLDKVSISMTINSTAPVLLAFLFALAKKRDLDPRCLRGTVQNDILKEFMARGTQRFPLDASMRLITDIFAWTSREMPRFNSISISGYHIREAGSTALEELAFTLADGIAYVEAAIAAGLEVDDFASRLSFFFNAHNNFFEEIAKFRAARKLWAEIMRERFHAKKEKSCQLRFHTQTAGSTLTAQQSENNVIRVTLQALSAVLGGTQSLHTNALDEALSLPSQKNAQIALRTQQIIAFESAVADSIDPLGGSPFVEALTEDLYRRARELIAEIDVMGGMVEAVKRSWPQEKIRRSAYRSQQAIDSGELKVLGVNCFQEEGEKLPPPAPSPKTDEKERARSLKALREGRNRQILDKKLQTVKEKAASGENLMPALVAAAEEYATIGELCTVLEEVFGSAI